MSGCAVYQNVFLGQDVFFGPSAQCVRDEDLRGGESNVCTEVNTFCRFSLQMFQPQFEIYQVATSGLCQLNTFANCLCHSLLINSMGEVLHTLLSADYMYLWCRFVGLTRILSFFPNIGMEPITSIT